MENERKKGFLEALQSLDEGTKKKIMIVASGVIMIAVIYFWLAYFNNIVASTTQPAVAQNAAQSGNGAAPLGNIKSGLAAIYAGFMNLLHDFGNILKAPRQYIVQPPQ